MEENSGVNTKVGQEAEKPKPVLVKRDYLVAAILLVVIVFLWIGFGVYKILTRTEIPEPIRGLARPLKLELPDGVFSDLKQRQNYRDRRLDEADRVILRIKTEGEIQTSL